MRLGNPALGLHVSSTFVKDRAIAIRHMMGRRRFRTDQHPPVVYGLHQLKFRATIRSQSDKYGKGPALGETGGRKKGSPAVHCITCII